MDVLYMTVREYAARVASSEKKIRDLCKTGELPSLKIGVGYKIDIRRADEYFARQIDRRQAELAGKKLRKERKTTRAEMDAQYTGATFVKRKTAAEYMADMKKEIRAKIKADMALAMAK